MSFVHLHSCKFSFYHQSCRFKVEGEITGNHLYLNKQNMLNEKTFLKVSDINSRKNLSEMCPQHEQRTKMLSNDHIRVSSQKSKSQTRNMKQSYIQLVITTVLITFLMRKYFVTVYDI